MIEYVTGKVAELTPATAVIETAGGVGYMLNITLPTYTKLDGQQTAKLLVHEVIREDAWTLYGFLDDRERNLFRELIGVSGVGAATARIILSSIPVQDLQLAIATGDVAKLKNVKGIGQKTAQRIIVDLKGKIELSDTDDEAIPAQTSTNDIFEEALAALVTLGFQRAASQKVLKKLFAENPAIKIDEAIKRSFTML